MKLVAKQWRDVVVLTTIADKSSCSGCSGAVVSVAASHVEEPGSIPGSATRSTQPSILSGSVNE